MKDQKANMQMIIMLTNRLNDANTKAQGAQVLLRAMKGKYGEKADEHLGYIEEVLLLDLDEPEVAETNPNNKNNANATS